MKAVLTVMAVMAVMAVVAMVFAPMASYADSIVEDTAEASYARAAAQDPAPVDRPVDEGATVTVGQTSNFGGAGHDPNEFQGPGGDADGAGGDGAISRANPGDSFGTASTASPYTFFPGRATPWWTLNAA